MSNEKIVKSIKELCKKHGITANQLESEVGLSQGLISRWLKTTPSLDKIIDIADYFNVSLDEVIGRRKNTSNQNDLFVNQIYEMTQNGELEWIDNYLLSYTNEFYRKIERYTHGFDMDVIEFFVADYKSGRIMLLMQYDIDHVKMVEYKADLFIQVDGVLEIIHEDCDDEQLYELWKCVRSKIYGEPDETKVEKFKEEIIANRVKEDEQIYEKISNIDLEKIQQIQKILTPELMEALNTISKITIDKK